MDRSGEDDSLSPGPEAIPTPGRLRERAAQLAEAMRRTDANPAFVRAVRATREFLPGDAQFGDELSTAGDRPAEILARYLTETGTARSSASREVGLTALQLWQALSQATGRGAGEQSVTILFTDLVGFSSWVLEVGDEVALELLRQVAAAVEPTVRERGGRIIKRLGDGHMAAFTSAQDAIDAALDIQDHLAEVEVEGYRPQLRTGVHAGRPRKLGGDYLGADVNITARLAEAADGGEVLVSGIALDQSDSSKLEVKRRRRFRAKGAPRELEVFAVKRAR